MAVITSRARLPSQMAHMLLDRLGQSFGPGVTFVAKTRIGEMLILAQEITAMLSADLNARLARMTSLSRTVSQISKADREFGDDVAELLVDEIEELCDALGIVEGDLARARDDFQAALVSPGRREAAGEGRRDVAPMLAELAGHFDRWPTLVRDARWQALTIADVHTPVCNGPVLTTPEAVRAALAGDP